MAADFNEDDILDLVATEYVAGTVAVLLGQGSGGIGDGTFVVDGHYGMGLEPFEVDVGDLNSDGILDLVAVNGSSGGTRILFGNGTASVGDGTFGPASFIIPSGNSAAVVSEDFNLDGLIDLGITTAIEFVNTPLHVYPGNGTGGNNDGTFDLTDISEYLVGEVPLHIAIGDYNEDGMLDAITSNFRSNYISVLLGSCTPGPPFFPDNPQLVSVSDVPNDQGGKVFLKWLRSGEDELGGIVRNYRVWRRVPPNLAASLSLSEVNLPGSRYRTTRVTSASGVQQIVFWEAIKDLPAQRLDGYGFAAPTTQDSHPDSNPFTAFFVSALTSSIDVFYNSNVDSGYSVDNLSPSAPQNLNGFFDPSVGVTLQWSPNEESDLSHYAVYREDTADFVPSNDNRIGTTAKPSFVDEEGLFNFYKVSAIDVHTNESGFAVIASEDIPVPTLIRLFTVEAEANGIRVTADFGQVSAGGTVQFLRAVEPEFDLAQPVGEPRTIRSGLIEYLDTDIQPGVGYWYWIELGSEAGPVVIQGPIRAEVGGPSTTGVSPASPNPFRHQTAFSYVIGSDIAAGRQVPVGLSVFGLNGRRVRTLLSGRQGVGEYRVVWDGTSDSGWRRCHSWLWCFC
jgi:hypothetical protein